ncbi:DUF924 family protein [Nissabacter sp. SGAir0207]|uniref:DUF924 family protein n=1 Tax=Nissabacter sp. SGAir0207 TaxID=2126321 RepID=UPI0010CD4FBE|nr:DUF924 family protein [Nissabacter sp. SGAir0207]QCR38337.1 DUF924 domain-containing protein [Nissabacter sp. SGAir0207]
MEYEQVLAFWFDEAGEAKWFSKDEQFDQTLRERFGECWQAACRGELSSWRHSLRGRLAEVIVLDQFSRNLARQDAAAWAQDGMALVLSQEAMRQPGWQQLPTRERAFLLMPWMHAESRVIHQQAVALFEALGDAEMAHHARQHREIIERFGRYPHRNARLGRASTPEEARYLKENQLPFF